MAATIIAQTVSAVTEKLIELNNAQFGRIFSIPGGTWTKIRVGVRYWITDTGGNLGGTPRFAVGLGSGVSAMIGDANTTNWIGAMTNILSWTRTAGPPPFYANVTLSPATKVAALTTFGASSLSGIWVCGAGATTLTDNRYLLFVDITKGSPNFTVGGFAKQNAVNSPVSQATFLAQMVNDPPTVAQHSALTNRTMAFDEVPGALDSIQVWWNRADALMGISDIAVARLA